MIIAMMTPFIMKVKMKMGMVIIINMVIKDADNCDNDNHMLLIEVIILMTLIVIIITTKKNKDLIIHR